MNDIQADDLTAAFIVRWEPSGGKELRITNPSVVQIAAIKITINDLLEIGTEEVEKPFAAYTKSVRGLRSDLPALRTPMSGADTGGRLPDDLQAFHRLQCLITGHERSTVMKGGGHNDAVRRIMMRKEGVVSRNLSYLRRNGQRPDHPGR